MRTTHPLPPHPWSGALLALLMLTSCRSGGGSAAHGPAYDAAVKNLTSQIEGVSVNAQWIVAERHNRYDPSFPTIKQGPSISDTIDNCQVRYSNSRVTSDGVFHVYESGKKWSSAIRGASDMTGERDIPVRAFSRVLVHDHEVGGSLEDHIDAKGDKSFGLVKTAPTQRLYHNMTGTWTVELDGKKPDDVHYLYFPNRQKAEAFAAAWRTLAAMK